MTTPSAYFTATIVVPWWMPAAAASPSSVGVGRPVRRSNSKKLGPGSSPEANVGRLMVPGRLPAVEASHALVDELALGGQRVGEGGRQDVGILVEEAQRVVAALAQQAPH